MVRNNIVDELSIDELTDLVASVISKFAFWDYGCDDFPAEEGGEPTEVVYDLAARIVECLT